MDCLKIVSKAGIALVALAFALSARTAHAGDLEGEWIVQDRAATVRIAPCGRALCGKVVSIEQPIDPATGAPWRDAKNVDPAKRARPILGLSVATGMRPGRSPGKWVGRVYSIDYGRDYAGSITLLAPTRLKIEGCQMMVCESEIWTKAE